MLPGTVVTFGSPIGLITWLWLFLDFEGFDFNRWRQVDTYFCWDPIVNKAGPGTPLKWVNVVNCLDPIASAFPDQAVDLSRTGDELRDELGGGVTHCHCGPAKFTATGRAHTDYLHDRDGFLEILQRAAGLRPGAVEEVACNRPRDHWSGTWRVLGRVRLVMWFTAIAFALGYCAIVAWHFQEWRVMAATFLFAIPAVTVGGMAFVQRFFFGGRTKRISRQRIASLRWDPVSLPYRLRQIAGDLRKRIAGLPLDDVGLPSHRPWLHRLNKLLAFLPTLAAMLTPAGIGWLITGRGPSRYMPVSGYVFPLLAFIIYLMACAVFELVSAWRSMLVDLELVPAARVAAKD